MTDEDTPEVRQIRELLDQLDGMRGERDKAHREASAMESERDDALTLLEQTREALARLVSTSSDVMNHGMTIEHVTEMADAMLIARRLQESAAGS